MAKVFTKSVKKMMASTRDVELHSHGYQVLRKCWEINGRDDKID